MWRAWSSESKWFFMHLMATYLPFLIHWAFSTSLNVPSPFFATSRYSAATAQGCSGRHPARGTLRGRGSAWRGGQAAPLGPVGTSAPLICPPLPAAPGGRPATRPAPPARGRQSTRARARGRALCISAASRLRQARSGRAPLASSVPGKPPLYLYAPRQRLGLAPTATVRLEAAPEPSQSSMRRRAPWPRLAACRSAGLRRRAQGFYCRPGSPGCLDRQPEVLGTAYRSGQRPDGPPHTVAATERPAPDSLPPRRVKTLALRVDNPRRVFLNTRVRRLTPSAPHTKAERALLGRWGWRFRSSRCSPRAQFAPQSAFKGPAGAAPVGPRFWVVTGPRRRAAVARLRWRGAGAGCSAGAF